MSNVREPEVTRTENKPSSIRRVYQNAKDADVAVVVLYANASKALFYDPEFKVPVPKADGLDLFIQGVVAVKGNVYYAPTSCTADGTITFPFPA